MWVEVDTTIEGLLAEMDPEDAEQVERVGGLKRDGDKLTQKWRINGTVYREAYRRACRYSYRVAVVEKEVSE